MCCIESHSLPWCKDPRSEIHTRNPAIVGARNGCYDRPRAYREDRDADLDWDSGRILSRATTTKQRRDARPDIKAALPYLEKICGGDVRLLPWKHAARTLFREFKRIQESAKDDEGNRLIDLPCQDAGNTDHTCNEWCHVYGFHAFRYAHARVNWANPQLQNQMGHASRATTEHYRLWAERQFTEYGATLPKLEDERKNGEQQQNGNKDSNKPRFRIVGT